MRTIEELFDQNVSRDEMTEEEERNFVNYWFDKYEKQGFFNVFISPYDSLKKYNGKKFKVIERVTEEKYDLESLPAWRIEFENREQIDAFPEEIIENEIRDNLFRETDKKLFNQVIDK